MSHPSPLAAVQHRALALRTAGDLAGACRLLTEAVESARPPYGQDHPDTLSTAHLLARLHREADEPTAARRVLEEAFAAGERRWTHADPLMLALSFELAAVADELGNRHEARRNYARVAAAGPAVLGADHPAVRTARQYLGDVAPAATPTGPAPAGPPPAAPPDPTSAGRPYMAPGTGTGAGAVHQRSPSLAALTGPTVSLTVLSTWQPHDGATTVTRPPQPPVENPTASGPGPSAMTSAPPAAPVPPVPQAPVPPVAQRPLAEAPRVPPVAQGPPAPQAPPMPPVAQGPPALPVTQGPPAPPTATPAEPFTAGPPRPLAPGQGSVTKSAGTARPPVAPREVAAQPTRAPGVRNRAEPEVAEQPASPAPGWNRPTIQVQQIEPLLAGEAGRPAAAPRPGAPPPYTDVEPPRPW